MGWGGFLNTVGQLFSGQGGGGDSDASLTQKILAGVGALGSTAGAMAGARAEGRAAQATSNLDRDRVASGNRNSHQYALLEAERLKEQAQNDAGNLDLKQKQFSLDAPGAKLANALRGGAAARLQDVIANRPNGVPNISFAGGLRPSLIGPAGRQAGSEMERQALVAMMNPEKFADLPSAHPQVLGELGLTPQPKEGILDKILGAAGTVGGLGTGVSNAQDAIKKVIAGRRRAPVPYLPSAGMPNAMPGTSVAMNVPGGQQPTDIYGGGIY